MFFCYKFKNLVRRIIWISTDDHTYVGEIVLDK